MEEIPIFDEDIKNIRWAERIYQREFDVINQFTKYYGFHWFTSYREKDKKGHLIGELGTGLSSGIYYCYDKRMLDYEKISFPTNHRWFKDWHFHWKDLIPPNVYDLKATARKEWVNLLSKGYKTVLDPGDPKYYYLNKYLLEVI